jgi:hypothetical protein
MMNFTFPVENFDEIKDLTKAAIPHYKSKMDKANIATVHRMAYLALVNTLDEIYKELLATTITEGVTTEVTISTSAMFILPVLNAVPKADFINSDIAMLNDSVAAEDYYDLSIGKIGLLAQTNNVDLKWYDTWGK